jgi:hypothetical protein
MSITFVGLFTTAAERISLWQHVLKQEKFLRRADHDYTCSVFSLFKQHAFPGTSLLLVFAVTD